MEFEATYGVIGEHMSRQKLSCEGLVAVGCIDFDLDCFAPELSDSTKISKDKFEIV